MPAVRDAVATGKFHFIWEIVTIVTATISTLCDLSREIDRRRAETLGCQHVVHFNRAGSSLMPGVVRDVVINHCQRETDSGGYEAADEATDCLTALYDSIARLIGANDPRSRSSRT